MRHARAGGTATRFLGVRLTTEEELLLERFRSDRSLPSRSDAVRALVREAALSRGPSVEIPVTLRDALDELVDEGYAHDAGGALETALVLGLRELSETVDQRLPALRERARQARERRTSRRRADREGRGLLER